VSEKEFVSASEWRAKSTKAILNSIDMAVRVLEDRVAKFASEEKRFILELAQGLIDLAKP